MTHEEFNNLWNNASEEQKCMAWNWYAYEERPDDAIYYNDEDFFKEMFANVVDAVRATYYGDFRYMDKFCWFNGYGNLCTSDFVDDPKSPVYPEELWEYAEADEDMLDELESMLG